MIITIIGGIGSGKSLSCVKHIVDSKNFPITNFKLKNIKYHRLMYENIIQELKEDRKIKYKVNWDFWEKFQNKNNYSIYLDEAHSLISARTSQSLRNRGLNLWVSQIRKILSDSTDNHLYIVTQLPRMIDVIFRELTQVVIECRLLKLKDKVYVIQSYYNGFDDLAMNRRSARSVFLGNPYFKYYNTKEMVRFKDAEDYV